MKAVRLSNLPIDRKVPEDAVLLISYDGKSYKVTVEQLMNVLENRIRRRLVRDARFAVIKAAHETSSRWRKFKVWVRATLLLNDNEINALLKTMFPTKE